MLMAYANIALTEKVSNTITYNSASNSNNVAKAKPNTPKASASSADYREWSKWAQVGTLLSRANETGQVDIAVEDGRVRIAAPRTYGAGTVFFAKDKNTLSRAFSLFPNDCRVTSWSSNSRDTAGPAPQGATQLACFAGFYGIDMYGAPLTIAATLVIVARLELKGQHAKIGKIYDTVKASKLFERGYYVVVGPSSQMVNLKMTAVQLNSSMPLAAFGAALATR